MRPSDYSERQNEYETFSKSIPIGIYGYFSESRIENLKKLKNFLIARKLNAKMSTDFENLHSHIISRAADAILSSEILYDSSKIHLFVVIPPMKDQNESLLDSVSMEYGWAWKTRYPYVGVYFQRGFEVSTLPQGALDVMRDLWGTETFDDIEDIFLNVSKYCEEKIREMYSYEMAR